MKDITNAYLVLSVADIRAMLAAAELEQVRREVYTDSVSLVLHNLVVLTDDEGRAQISSSAVARSVSASSRDTQEAIESK